MKIKLKEKANNPKLKLEVKEKANNPISFKELKKSTTEKENRNINKLGILNRKILSKRVNLGSLNPKQILILIAIIISSLAILLLVNQVFILQSQLQSTQFLAGINGNELNNREIENLQTIEVFSKIFDLNGEKPILATVVNLELVKQDNPEFYANAREGDKIIVLQERSLIFLFRLSESKIINVGKVSVGE